MTDWDLYIPFSFSGDNGRRSSKVFAFCSWSTSDPVSLRRRPHEFIMTTHTVRATFTATAREKPSSPNEPHASHDADSPSPRKTHRCKYCKRERKNHPRSGCPFVDPPVPAGEAKDTATLSDALEGLKLGPESPTRVKRTGRRSVPLELRVEGEIEAIISAPSPIPEAIHLAISAGPGDGQQTRPPTPPPIGPGRAQGRAKPLSRSLSQEETQVFLDRAKATAVGHATVLKATASAVPDILAGAKARGLKAQVIEYSSNAEDVRLVVVGKDEDVVSQIGNIGAREKEAVNTALQKEVRRGYHPALVSSAGAVAGAVATWTGLAFA